MYVSKALAGIFHSFVYVWGWVGGGGGESRESAGESREREAEIGTWYVNPSHLYDYQIAIENIYITLPSIAFKNTYSLANYQ